MSQSAGIDRNWFVGGCGLTFIALKINPHPSAAPIHYFRRIGSDVSALAIRQIVAAFGCGRLNSCENGRLYRKTVVHK